MKSKLVTRVILVHGEGWMDRGGKCVGEILVKNVSEFIGSSNIWRKALGGFIPPSLTKLL